MEHQQRIVLEDRQLPPKKDTKPKLNSKKNTQNRSKIVVTISTRRPKDHSHNQTKSLCIRYEDDRCDPWDRPNLYDQSSLTSKEKPIAPPVAQNANAHDEQSPSQSPKEDTHRSNEKSIFPDDFPNPLKSIKEYIVEQDGDTYIPLHSTKPLQKLRRMLNLPLKFGEITMDGLVDSVAFINAMSWSDYNIIKMNSDSCVTKEYPQPPFKTECANAQLEQPIVTVDIQFNIRSYTFTDTFVILSKTSFPIIGLNFMRNHQAVIDTANGTINFPHVKMTLAMPDEMKNCNPKPLQIMAEGNQTLLLQQKKQQ